MIPIGNSLTHRLAAPSVQPIGQPDQASAGAANSFADLLTSGFNSVNVSQQSADAQVHELMTGGDVSQVEVMSAVQKSDMAFRLLVQVRNKLMSAYDEINAIRI